MDLLAKVKKRFKMSTTRTLPELAVISAGSGNDCLCVSKFQRKAARSFLAQNLFGHMHAEILAMPHRSAKA